MVGAGIIGLSTAYELARRGAGVTVLERGLAGGESSWAGGGILSPLLPWDYADAVTRLTERSRDLFPEWAASLHDSSGIDPEYLASGMLVLSPRKPEKALAWCLAHGMAAEMVSATEVLPDSNSAGDALLLPDVAQVRNPRLLKALRRSLEEMGVRIVEHAEVSGIRVRQGRVEEVEAGGAGYVADSYVVAAGAWSHVLLGSLAPHAPIWPVRGQMLLFRMEPERLPRIVLSEGIYLIPRRDGHVLVGSTLEEAGFDKGITDAARNSLFSRALEIFLPLRQAELVRHWAGLRPGSTGNIPTIGRHPEIANLYLNSGHFRYGVTMAPASARILANLIAGTEQPMDVSPYAWR